MTPAKFSQFIGLMNSKKNASVKHEFLTTSLLIFSMPVVFFAIGHSSIPGWYKANIDPNVNADIFTAITTVVILHLIILRYVWKAMNQE